MPESDSMVDGPDVRNNLEDKDGIYRDLLGIDRTDMVFVDEREPAEEHSESIDTF